MREENASQQLLSNPKDVEKALKGEKTQVRRSDRYADVGDTIELGGRTFKFTKIYEQELGDMTDEDIRAEGYPSLEAYKHHLKNLHPFTRILPFMPWSKSKKVWVHQFEEVE
ncbi:MAG TPA: ASCH domain-containing protein [Bacillales bacterium]|nr:ASCH domain-containing protein [Bacillales bacterium]